MFWRKAKNSKPAAVIYKYVLIGEHHIVEAIWDGERWTVLCSCDRIFHNAYSLDAFRSWYRHLTFYTEAFTRAGERIMPPPQTPVNT